MLRNIDYNLCVELLFTLRTSPEGSPGKMDMDFYPSKIIPTNRERNLATIYSICQ